VRQAFDIFQPRTPRRSNDTRPCAARWRSRTSPQWLRSWSRTPRGYHGASISVDNGVTAGGSNAG